MMLIHCVWPSVCLVVSTEIQQNCQLTTPKEVHYMHIYIYAGSKIIFTLVDIVCPYSCTDALNADSDSSGTIHMHMAYILGFKGQSGCTSPYLTD